MKEKSPSLLQAELAISYLLRWGVLLCGAILAVGLALLLIKSTLQPQSASFLQQARHDPESAAAHVPRSLPAMLTQLRSRDANAVIAIGLMLLILLPIARVGATVVVFLIERDAIYFSITLFVFVVLATGILLGKAL